MQSRSEIMRAVKSKDTTPEMKVRKFLFARGFRYRLHVSNLPGKPDLVFRKVKKAIFVNGCFWHGHGCKRGNRLPKANAEYWRNKIENNKKRDANNIKKLEELGWSCYVVWECEINNNQNIYDKIISFLSSS